MAATKQELEHKGIKYLHYEPAAWNGGEILFLHGSGERGDDIEAIQRLDMPKQLNEGLDFGFRIIAPQLTKNYSGYIPRYFDAMEELIKSHKPRHKHVTGLSMGGIGALGMMKAKPGFFNTAGIVCGSCNLDKLENLVPTKIKAWHGTKDTTVKPGAIRNVTRIVKELGGDIELVELEGAGHGIWGHVYNPKTPNGYWNFVNDWVKQNDTEPIPEEPKRELIKHQYILNGELIIETESGSYKVAVTK